MKHNFIKIVLAIALTLCLFDMPYWYYQIIRIFGTIGFGYLAYVEYKSNKMYTPYVFGTAAILLNPIIKISFGREMWNVVDIILAVLIILSILFSNKLLQKENP